MELTERGISVVAQLVRRLANSLWLMMALFVFLVCALYFVANTGEHLDSFGQSYQWLMLSTAFALGLIGILILASVWRLAVDLRQNCLLYTSPSPRDS